MTRELTAVDRVPAVREVAPVQPMFGAEAAFVIQRTTEVANVLKQAIRDQGLSRNISGREYVFIDGWTLAGTMLDVFPRTVRVDPLPDGSGYEAEAALVTRSGEVVGGAIAECSRSEKTWSTRDAYALKSMAQTRAVAKAYRMSFGFVMSMAGFEATPGEEMPHDERPQQRSQAAKPAPFASLRAELNELREATGIELADIERVLGVTPTMGNIQAWLEQHNASVRDLVRLAGEQAEPAPAEQPEQPAEQPEPEPFPETPSTLDGLLRYSRGQGLTDDQLLEVLEVETISAIQAFGLDAAKVAIDDYLDRQIGAGE